MSEKVRCTARTPDGRVLGEWTTDEQGVHEILVKRPVIQDWVLSIPMMQQTVLLTAIRGPDGMPKYSSTKMLLRWYRRCVLLSAMDGKVLSDPVEQNGGSFTGPSIILERRDDDIAKNWESRMDAIVGEYLREADVIPHHFQMHLLHAIEILGYKHPEDKIADWWRSVYMRLVASLHLHIESREEMDERLGDTREGWLKRSDKATTA